MNSLCYPIIPSPDFLTEERAFVNWEDAFLDEEVLKIIQLGEFSQQNNGHVTGFSLDHLNEETLKDIQNIRKCKVSWIEYQNFPELYDKMGSLIRLINGQFFDLDLFGFVEPFQYTKYEAPDSHYVWHSDKYNQNGKNIVAPRKLSVVLQLSDANEYEGGQLELNIGASENILIPKKKGLLCAFPSYILHRVTPVTAGIRRSLVCWVSGNRFR